MFFSYKKRCLSRVCERFTLPSELLEAYCGAPLVGHFYQVLWSSLRVFSKGGLDGFLRSQLRWSAPLLLGPQWRAQLREFLSSVEFSEGAGAWMLQGVPESCNNSRFFPHLRFLPMDHQGFLQVIPFPVGPSGCPFSGYTPWALVPFL